MCNRSINHPRARENCGSHSNSPTWTSFKSESPYAKGTVLQECPITVNFFNNFSVFRLLDRTKWKDWLTASDKITNRFLFVSDHEVLFNTGRRRKTIFWRGSVELIYSKKIVTILFSTGCSHWSRPKWRIIHPRINPIITFQLEIRLEHIFIHRYLCCCSVTVYLPRRDLHWGTPIPCREIIQDVSSSRCDAPQKIEWQDVRARAIPWTYVCF